MVRTARLADGITGAAQSSVVAYQCPAGKTAIVKDIRLSPNGAGPVGTIVTLSSGPRFCNIFFDDVAGNDPRSLQPWIVLEPGDIIYVFSSTAGGITFWISGTELDGVAP